MKTISEFVDLFPIAAIVRIYDKNRCVYDKCAYGIPQKYLYIGLNSFKVCFEDNRLIYKFWI